MMRAAGSEEMLEVLGSDNGCAAEDRAGGIDIATREYMTKIETQSRLTVSRYSLAGCMHPLY